MADINEARQQMMEELQRKIQTDSKLSSIRSKIQNGDYSEASQYGMRSGEILSEVIRGNITEELFQQCDVKGLGEMLLPVIKQENQYVSNAVSAAQKAQNAEVGIGIKPLQAENDLNSYFNIFTKMKSDAYESFEQASWLLDEPIVHDSLSIVDDTLKENADFQYKSGLRTCVIRDAEPDCCDWCAERAGTYYYPDVPDSVWERHNNCLCEIRIETEKDAEVIPILDSNTGHERRVLIDYRNDNISEQRDKRIELNNGGAIPLSSNRFLTHTDSIYNRSKKVIPEEGYDDVFVHGDEYGFCYYDLNGNEVPLSVKQVADMLLEYGTFENDAIRLCSCGTGAPSAITAQKLADFTGKNVLAPDKILWIYGEENGICDMVIADPLVIINEDGTEEVLDEPDLNKKGSWIPYAPNRKE